MGGAEDRRRNLGQRAGRRAETARAEAAPRRRWGTIALGAPAGARASSCVLQCPCVHCIARLQPAGAGICCAGGSHAAKAGMDGSEQVRGGANGRSRDPAEEMAAPALPNYSQDRLQAHGALPQICADHPPRRKCNHALRSLAKLTSLALPSCQQQRTRQRSRAGAIDNTAGPDPEDESERAAPPPPEFRRSTGARPGSDEFGKSSLRQCKGRMRTRSGATSVTVTWRANVAPVVAVPRCSRQCEPAAALQTHRCRTAAHAGPAGLEGRRTAVRTVRLRRTAGPAHCSRPSVPTRPHARCALGQRPRAAPGPGARLRARPAVFRRRVPRTLRAYYSVLSRAATCVHGRERAPGETHSSAPKSAWSTGGKNDSAMRQPVTPRTRYLAASVPFQPSADRPHRCGEHK
jgi:hypothetical protein